MRSGTVVMLIAAAVSAPAAAKEKLAIAALRTGEGLPADSPLGRQIVNYLNEAIGGDPALAAAFEVVPTSQTQIQLFGLGCYDAAATMALPACLAEVGKRSGADRVLFGNLSLADGRYKVELRAASNKGEAVEVNNPGAAGTVLLATDWSDAVESLKKPLYAALKIEPPPPVPPPPPPVAESGSGMRYAAWGTAIGGALALGLGAYFGASASTMADDLAVRNRAQGRYLDADLDDIRGVRSDNTMANILFGLGAALAVTSGALFYAVPAPGPGGGAMLSVGGSF